MTVVPAPVPVSPVRGRLVFCGLTGCSDSSGQMAPWGGSWRAIETYMRGDAFAPVAAAVHEQRPEYSTQEIQDIFAGFHDVDFTELHVEGADVSFEADGTVLCEGRYESHAADHDGDDADHDHGVGVHLELLRTRQGDCEPDFEHVDFASLPIEQLLDDGELLAHFHLTAGVERAQPWSPGVIEPIEDALFTAMQMENVDVYAAALPER